MAASAASNAADKISPSTAGPSTISRGGQNTVAPLANFEDPDFFSCSDSDTETMGKEGKS